MDSWIQIKIEKSVRPVSTALPLLQPLVCVRINQVQQKQASRTNSVLVAISSYVVLLLVSGGNQQRNYNYNRSTIIASYQASYYPTDPALLRSQLLSGRLVAQQQAPQLARRQLLVTGDGCYFFILLVAFYLFISMYNIVSGRSFRCFFHNIIKTKDQ